MLKLIVCVVLFLGERSLGFRGSIDSRNGIGNRSDTVEKVTFLVCWYY